MDTATIRAAVMVAESHGLTATADGLRDMLACHDPAADYLGHLARLAASRPDLGEFIKRLAGSVRKLESLI